MGFSLKDRPITQGVIGNAVYAALILGGAAVLAILNAWFPQWFTFALWGFIGAGLTAVVVIAFILLTRIPKRDPQITTENIEKHIRLWLDSFRVAFKKIDEPEVVSQTIFALHATLDNGLPVVISQPRLFDRYIAIESSISIGPEEKVFFDKLPAEEKGVFGARLSVELSKTSMGFHMDLAQNRITLLRRVPITENLTESGFMQAVDELDNARLRALRILSLMLIDVRNQVAPQRNKLKPRSGKS